MTAATINNIESEIINSFRSYGFEIEKIQEEDEETPDFLIRFAGRTILIELKTKFDDEASLNRMREELAEGKVHTHMDALIRKNRISGVISKAYKQLKQKKEKLNAEECYIYFHAEGPNAGVKRDQFIATIYGRKLIIPLGAEARKITYCYYYTYSDFFRYQDVISGAFAGAGSKVRLCLNNYAHNYEDIKASPFVAEFVGGVFDPLILEQEGEAFVLDSAIDRADDLALREYLRKKYSIPELTVGDFPTITVSKRVSLCVIVFTLSDIPLSKRSVYDDRTENHQEQSWSTETGRTIGQRIESVQSFRLFQRQFLSV